MLDLLFLVFVFPLAGFVVLAFARGRLKETPAAIVGVGSIGLSFLVTILVGISFLQHPPEGHAHVQLLWRWMDVGGFAPNFALYLDGLSLTMLGVITGVGFFIHLFASWYMRGDPGYDRFFSYMNLFVASMLFLVLGDDLLFLYFGWEGVGLCSYLLIGFWYEDPANGVAARKAFIVTRVGDTLMALGLFVLWHELGTLNIQELLVKAPNHWPVGSQAATLAALLLLGGAVGKSAQLPLHTWLPDAMAGPTPVSALIHAATMVTAGVYLIARTHVLFELAPLAQNAVGWIGAIGLLVAAFAGLAQRDIKRILAYSTMSQIAYMFLALGVGAWTAAIFHLMTHAFFKALLFLTAGSIILALHHEQDIFKMGGLRKRLPFVFGVFLIGSLALVAVPPTAGFFSKDEILWQAWASGHHELFWCGLAGAFMTALYTFRLIFTVFFGEPQGEVHVPHGAAHTLPLAVLAVLSVAGGFIHLPLESVLPHHEYPAEGEHEIMALSVGAGVAGVVVAWLVFHLRPQLRAAIAANPAGGLLRRYWAAAWGFDWLYDLLFVRPYLWIVHANRNDVAETVVASIPVGFKRLHARAAQTQTGQIRWYAASVAAGAVIVLGVIVWSAR
ncbi:MAG TPA: NADH-quinone oxidoreductase subunit L [Candidatus Binatia bacterium]|nr:NADH-quinone oxidoreductase subunit L [Candidatus Binatia bacterium]